MLLVIKAVALLVGAGVCAEVGDAVVNGILARVCQRDVKACDELEELNADKVVVVVVVVVVAVAVKVVYLIF